MDERRGIKIHPQGEYRLNTKFTGSDGPRRKRVTTFSQTEKTVGIMLGVTLFGGFVINFLAPAAFGVLG